MFRLLVAAFASLSLLACTSMQTVRSTEKAALRKTVKVGDEVQVDATNGKRYLLVLTVVDDEKIIGLGDNKKVTIRYGQIKAMEVRKVSAGKTAGLTVGVVAASLLLVIALFATGVINPFKNLGD